jgi:hypothetical protein
MRMNGKNINMKFLGDEEQEDEEHEEGREGTGMNKRDFFLFLFLII